MAKKSSRPALYELIHQRLGLGVSSASHRLDTGDAPPAEESQSWLSPGRSLRIPVGFLFLAGAAIIAIAIVAYMVGYRAGGRAMEAEYGDRLGALGMDPVRDPLLERHAENRSDDSGNDRGQSAAEAVQAPAGRPGEPPPRIVNDDRQWGPLESDPRREDLHYFILATTRPEGARRLAEFCRANGLEAYVVPGNNARSRCVTVLPGFQTRSGPNVQNMRDEIRRVGALWKARYPVESDLKDAFLP